MAGEERRRLFLYRYMGSYVGPKRADVFIRSCMGYVYERSVEHSYRMYVTRQLVASVQNKYIGFDWDDGMPRVEEQPKTDGEAVLRDVVSRAGLVVRVSEPPRPSGEGNM